MKSIFSLPDSKRILSIMLYGSLELIAFIVIYGFCNKVASESSYTYSMFTNWELEIPLIPWMIYPYISLNLLFLIAIFIIHETTAIRGYLLSMTFSVMIAGVVFYYFPGQLGFQRVGADGYEWIFDFMFSIDHPHNLFPSLHVTYSSLSVWVMIEQARNKKFSILMNLWLIAICASVVLVHQHHLFDILTGFLLAIIAFKFIFKKNHKTNFKPLYIL